jgi:hypothetical protein
VSDEIMPGVVGIPVRMEPRRSGPGAQRRRTPSCGNSNVLADAELVDRVSGSFLRNEIPVDVAAA